MRVETIGNATLYLGDVLDGLAQIEDESVHTCITSPPYWGLRDYGVDGQIGLEPTLAEFIDRLVAVFEEVRRVLRSDGTAWVNMGDAYVARPNGGVGHNSTINGQQSQVEYRAAQAHRGGKRPAQAALKYKDLIGQPWRLAFALQEAGWYLRQDIIWHKPNPMPESVRDRCTKSHEQIFLFAKGQWKTRVVKFADLPSERMHFGQHLGLETPDVWSVKVAGHLATAIFYSSQQQQNFGLPPFYSEVWQQRPDGMDSDFVCSLPVEHRATAWAARLLAAHVTTKEFLHEINRLTVALPNRNDLLKSWCSTDFLSPAVDCDGETAIAVKDSGQVCEIDFLHEQIVLRAPATCKYYFDQEAIKEPAGWDPSASKMPDGWATHEGGHGSFHRDGREKGRRSGNKERKPASARGVPGAPHGGGSGGAVAGSVPWEGDTRNKRSVWTVPTKPFPEAHFATFPPELIEPCVLAGAPEGGVVLDCFAGSGTTGVVALEHGRKFVGIELNPEYMAMVRRRCDDAQRQARLFA